MAKAWVGRDWQGRVCVFGEGQVDGERRQRRKRVPKDDESLANEVARELNSRFLLEDLGWLREGRRPKTRTRPRPKPLQCPTLADWGERWIESLRPPELSESTWRNYRTHKNAIVARFGDLRLDELDLADVRRLETQMRRSGKSESTIKDRVGVLRMMVRDARVEGVAKNLALEVPLPKRQTKQKRREQRARRVIHRPFAAEELETLLKVLRSPDMENRSERLYFGITEVLLLTGLRWQEPSAWIWPDVSFSSGLVLVERANSRYSRGDLGEPTKTGHTWTVRLTDPLRELLLRQRAQSRAGRPDGWVFPNADGGPLDYHNWRKRGWVRALERAKVQPREGNAQKALRKAYITSSLICGRNPKEVASEVGHATLRMVVEQYDSFIDPAAWPDEDERERLRTVYGWTKLPATSLQSATETQT